MIDGMIDSTTLAMVGGVLGMVFVGEYLSLGADTGKTLKPSEKKVRRTGSRPSPHPPAC